MPIITAPLTPPPTSPSSRTHSPPPTTPSTPPPSLAPSRTASPHPFTRNPPSTTPPHPLSAPRILCLHGGGTNARIFRLQCRILSRTLSPHFRLVFAQAPFPAQPGSDVTAVYKQYGPFRGWLRSALAAAAREHNQSKEREDDNRQEEIDDDANERRRTSREVVEELVEPLDCAMRDDDATGATGAWVGVLGFSQGAKVAASILLTQQIFRRHPSHPPSRSKLEDLNPALSSLPAFHFGVLIAGRGPLVWLTPDTAIDLPAGMAEAARPSITGVADEEMLFGGEKAVERLRTPTLHVHGLRDPGLELHRRMMGRWCGKGNVGVGARREARVLEWEGEHRVAIKTKDVDKLVQAILGMALEVRWD